MIFFGEVMKGGKTILLIRLTVVVFEKLTLSVSISASELEDNVPKPTCPSTGSSDAQKAPASALPSESKEQTVTLGERTFNCCYPGET